MGVDIKTRTKGIAAKAIESEPPVFLRTLDGIHIATAFELSFSELITADRKMADAALLFGLKSKFLK